MHDNFLCETPMPQDLRIIISTDDNGNIKIDVPNPELREWLECYLGIELPEYIEKHLDLVGSKNWNFASPKTKGLIKLMSIYRTYGNIRDRYTLDEMYTEWNASHITKRLFFETYNCGDFQVYYEKNSYPYTICLRYLERKYNTENVIHIGNTTFIMMKLNPSYGTRRYSAKEFLKIYDEIDIYAYPTQAIEYTIKLSNQVNGAKFSYKDINMYMFTDINGKLFNP